MSSTSEGSDEILDSGASNNFFNNKDLVSNFKINKEQLYFPDSSSVEIIGTGDFGILKGIKIAPKLKRSLISEAVLTSPPYNLMIIHDHKKAYVFDEKYDCLIATASKQLLDNLYHIDDMSKFKAAEANYIVLKKTYSDKEMLKGSARSQYLPTVG
jgi:hypothetical protein